MRSPRQRRWFVLALTLSALVVIGALQIVPDRSRDELIQWQDKHSQFASVAGMQIHYRLEGNPDGPLLVLLHGTAASLHTWDGWVDTLGDDFRLLRLDLPAFGLTGAHPKHDYSIAAYVEVLEQLVSTLGLGEFALAGNSLGGNIAWRYALDYPQRIRALVLLNASGLPSETPSAPSLVFRLANTPVLNRLLVYMAPRSIYEKSLLEVYADDSKVTEALIERYRDLSLFEGNREAFVARIQLERIDKSGRLGEISAPTLILWGALDAWIPATHAQRFNDAIADSHVIVYPDLGHLPMEEAPSRSASDVAAFLAAADR
ncbi:MAG: alpha/beta hydrolase [Pseudomonadota bacterium]